MKKMNFVTSYSPAWKTDSTGRNLVLHCLLDKRERPFTLYEIMRQNALKFLLDSGVSKCNIKLDAVLYVDGELNYADMLVKKANEPRLVIGFTKRPNQSFKDAMLRRYIGFAEANNFQHDETRKVPAVWLTNGFGHRFYEFRNGWEWQETEDNAFPCGLTEPEPARTDSG